MAYSDFTFTKLRKQYGITQDAKMLFPSVSPVVPSERLVADVTEGQQMPMLTEKAKSEFIIAPILREVQRNHPEISIFSGVSLSVEGDKDLTGTPDFLLNAGRHRASIDAPIFCLLEVKNQSIEEGYAQCAAEMYAATIINEQMQEKAKAMYGAATNGFEWVFIKLENKILYIDLKRYYLSELTDILGIFRFIIQTH